MADVQDLYIERFDPADPTRYQTEAGWRQAEIQLEAIAVKGRSQPHVERVLVTRHGPVIATGVAEEDRKRRDAEDAEGAEEKTSNRRDAEDVEGAEEVKMSSDAPARAHASGAVEALALRWTAYEPNGLVGALLDLNRAADWPSFRAALAGWTCPPQNFVYADVDGHIGYATGGAIPLRSGWDGALPVAGWDGAHEWQGFIPNAELPHVLDPADGQLVTANNRIVDDRYPHPFHAAWLNGYRAARIGALLRATPQHSPQSFAQIHADQLSLPGLALAKLADRLPAETAVAAAARAALSDWDGTLSAASVGGMIYARLREHLLAEAYAEIAGLNDPLGLGAFASLPLEGLLVRAFPEVVRRCAARDDAWLGGGRSWDSVLANAWESALADMRAELGEDVAAWRYGRWHTLTIGHPLGAVPALARLLNRGPIPLGGDIDTICMGNKPRTSAGPPSYTAPSYRQIIDVGAWDACQSVHPTGQSGHPASPHYADFLPEWRAVRYHPMPWSRERIKEHAAATLILTPA